MNRAPEYTLGNSKPLINREQNYVLDRKLLTVHSEDRDITKWPNSNTFEIMLPEQLLNVQSMRLIQATLPAVFFTFSNDYQNTKFIFTVDSVEYTATIQEGFYTPAQLALELTNKMNQAIADTTFTVFYDEVKNTFWFGNNYSEFILNFDQQIVYDFSNCEQPLVWNNHSKWGLPYYLGFQKLAYQSTNTTTNIVVDGIVPSNINLPTVDVDTIIHYIVAPSSFTLIGETCIYLEVDKYNYYDELYPYNESTNHTKQIFSNNAYSGKVNSAFAKIPIRPFTNDYSYDSRTIFLLNMVHYDPPIERIARLKFKFRFHDGRLVNFQNFPFDFTIEFNSLRNEIEKKYTVRVPAYVL